MVMFWLEEKLPNVLFSLNMYMCASNTFFSFIFQDLCKDVDITSYYYTTGTSFTVSINSIIHRPLKFSTNRRK